jgi:hypothetical protein
VVVIERSHFLSLVEAGRLDESEWGVEVEVSGGFEHSSLWCRAVTGPSSTQVVAALTRPCPQCHLAWHLAPTDPDVGATVALLLRATSSLSRVLKRTTPGVLSARRTHLRALAAELEASVRVESSQGWHDEVSAALARELLDLDAALDAQRSTVLLWAATQAVAEAPPLDLLPGGLTELVLAAAQALEDRAGAEAAGSSSGTSANPESASATTNWGPRTLRSLSAAPFPSRTRVVLTPVVRAWREHLKAVDQAGRAEALKRGTSLLAERFRAAGLPEVRFADLSTLVEESLRVLSAERERVAEQPGQFLVARPRNLADTSARSLLDGFSEASVLVVPYAVGAWAETVSSRVGLQALEVDDVGDELLEVLSSIFDPGSEVTLAEALEAARAL